MSTASLVGHVALIAAGRSPTPAPWSPVEHPAREEEISRELPAQSATGLQAEASATSGSTLSLVHALRLAPAGPLGDTKRCAPPPISTATVYVAFWGLFAFNALRVLFAD